MADLLPACGRGFCPDAEYWRAEALQARGALQPGFAALLPRLIDPELLAYDDAPTPVGVGERLVGLALAGPWIACTAGWSLAVAGVEAWRWLRA